MMRLTGARMYSRPAPVPKMPPGLVELMEGLTKDVLKHNPPDIYEFCANHMQSLLDIRDGSAPKKILTLEQKISRAQAKVKKQAEQRRKEYDQNINLLSSNVDDVQKDNDVSQETDSPMLEEPNKESILNAPVHREKDLADALEVEIFQKPMDDLQNIEENTSGIEEEEASNKIMESDILTNVENEEIEPKNMNLVNHSESKKDNKREDIQTGEAFVVNQYATSIDDTVSETDGVVENGKSSIVEVNIGDDQTEHLPDHIRELRSTYNEENVDISSDVSEKNNDNAKALEQIKLAGVSEERDNVNILVNLVQLNDIIDASKCKDDKSANDDSEVELDKTLADSKKVDKADDASEVRLENNFDEGKVDNFADKAYQLKDYNDSTVDTKDNNLFSGILSKNIDNVSAGEIDKSVNEVTGVRLDSKQMEVLEQMVDNITENVFDVTTDRDNSVDVSEVKVNNSEEDVPKIRGNNDVEILEVDAENTMNAPTEVSANISPDTAKNKVDVSTNDACKERLENNVETSERTVDHITDDASEVRADSDGFVHVSEKESDKRADIFFESRVDNLVEGNNSAKIVSEIMVVDSVDNIVEKSSNLVGSTSKSNKNNSEIVCDKSLISNIGSENNIVLIAANEEQLTEQQRLDRTVRNTVSDKGDVDQITKIEQNYSAEQNKGLSDNNIVESDTMIIFQSKDIENEMIPVTLPSEMNITNEDVIIVNTGNTQDTLTELVYKNNDEQPDNSIQLESVYEKKTEAMTTDSGIVDKGDKVTTTEIKELVEKPAEFIVPAKIFSEPDIKITDHNAENLNKTQNLSHEISGEVTTEPPEGNEKLIEISASSATEILSNSEKSSDFKISDGEPEIVSISDIQDNIFSEPAQPGTETISMGKSSSMDENTIEDTNDSILELDTMKTADDSMQNFHNPNAMDLETAAITIQKVFRTFLFKSRASTFDDTGNDDHNLTDEDNEKEEVNFPITTAILNKERRALGISRMDTVLQTVNEEKSLSLSTDDSSTISSAATIIQAHVRGYLVRNKMNSNKTASTNSLVNSDGPSATSLEADNDQQKTSKTVLNIHIVPGGDHFLSRDESMLTSMDLSLDGSPPSSSNLHPLGYNKNEPRKQLKREDAIQSISPPTNNSGKLSEDSVKEITIQETTSNNDDTVNAPLQDVDEGSRDTTPTKSTTIETVIEAHKYSKDSSSSLEKENKGANVNKPTLTKTNSDESDVVTPFVDNELKNLSTDSDNTSGLLHSGEFHDVVLPTKVSRSEASVVRGE